MENNKIVVKKSRFLLFIFLLMVFLILIIFNVSIFLSPAYDIPIPALLLFIPWYVLLGFSLYISAKNRFRIVKFSLTPENVSMSFHRKVYFESKLDLINQINVFRISIEKRTIRYKLYPTEVSEAISIEFIGNEFERMIDLWCCGFSYRKQCKIADLMMNIGEKYHKEVRIYENQSIILNKSVDPCSHINEFLKKS